MMAGVGLTGVFLWYLVRFWVYGKACTYVRAADHSGRIPHCRYGCGHIDWCRARLLGRRADFRANRGKEHSRGPCGGRCLPAVCRWFGARMGLGVWSTGTARENGMLLFALISGFAFGVYDSLGLELVMDSLPDPRRAGHDLGIYALANSAGLALAAIIGALLVNAFEHSFGYYLLFPSAIVMVLLAGIVTLTTKSAE